MSRKKEKKRDIKPVHFDRWQFAGRRPRAVSQDTGIAFTDYSRMHVQRREVTPERRLPTPMWALKDEYLRELLVTYLEERFYIRKPVGTLRDRLEKIRVAAEAVRPRKFQQLEEFVRDYNTLKQNGLPDMTDDAVLHAWKEHSSHDCGSGWKEQPSNLISIATGDANGAQRARTWLESYSVRMLEIQILNLDTDLVLTARDGGAAAVAAVVYLYYRNGWDSVAVAEELGFKPPHIRQLLWRMNLTWVDSGLRERFEGVTADDKDRKGNKAARETAVSSDTRQANAKAGEVTSVPDSPFPQFSLFAKLQ